MQRRRIERISELVHQEISRHVLELNDPDIAFVTITSVEVVPDLSEARVYYSVLGTNEECEHTKAALNRAAPLLRQGLGKLENLKKAPKVIFIYDNTPARAARVFELLNQIQHEGETQKVRPSPKKTSVQKRRASNQRKTRAKKN